MKVIELVAAMFVPICLIIFFTLLIVGVIIAGLLWKRWTDKKLGEMCAGKGWTYYGNNVPNGRAMIKGTSLDRGHSQKLYYGIGRDHHGIHQTTFQWQFTTGGGKHQTTHHYKVALMPMDFRENGYIFIRRESLLDKMGGVFGFNDLDFEHQAFSDKYYVRAKPEKFGYNFFNPRMIEFFMKYNAFDMVVKNNTVMLYMTGSMGGMSTVFSLRKGKNPFTKWMESSGNFLVNIKRRVPKFMKRKEAKVVGVVKDEKAPIVGKPFISGKKMVPVVCPNCAVEFKYPHGSKSVTCPECGVEGEL